MNQARLFDIVSSKCSQFTTSTYSTSFSIGIHCLDRSLRGPIYAIYGFVRFADEIVDTFHEHDKARLLNDFRQDTFRAIEAKISLNPILHSFQKAVHEYQIDHDLIHTFLNSMEMDLTRQSYTNRTFEQYVLGSAEVVGLMCLKVFCHGNQEKYDQLKPFAMKLGSAFQKINFLRDLNEDYQEMGRSYFPEVDLEKFDEASKRSIEASIADDFHQGYIGIKQLPRSSRLGVYVAYLYYLALFRKIKNTPSEFVLRQRIRINNRHKITILAYSFLKHQFNLI